MLGHITILTSAGLLEGSPFGIKSKYPLCTEVQVVGMTIDALVN